MLPHGKWEDRFGYTFASFPASGFRRPAGSVAQLVEQRTENPCVGGSIPPRATNTQRLTVLGWAFSFARGPRHAGQRAVLRVPPLPRHGAEQGAVRFGIALCSLETFANRFAVAHADP